MNIIYREVEEQDNFQLAKMIRAVFEEFDAPRTGTVFEDPSTDNLFQLFQEPKAILWVAEINDEAIGCCGIFPTEGLPDNCGELVKFYLSNTARGKGVGKELMLRSITSAKELRYTSIYLESLPDFSKAIRMYEESGFKTVKKQLGNSGHSSCNVWMTKSLI